MSKMKPKKTLSMQECSTLCAGWTHLL